MGRLTPIAELELVQQVVPGAGQPGNEPCLPGHGFSPLDKVGTNAEGELSMEMTD